MVISCGRYAPTPSGRLHLGNARTALLAWLWARAQGGRYVMRVEDLDPDRSRPVYERDQLDDLLWLGLPWDEGPRMGGPQAPYRQSERGQRYAAALADLETFECTCTRRELREATLAPHGREPVYPGTCRAAVSHPDRPAAVRWKVPPGVVEVDDLVAGRLREDVVKDVGDFVLRRTDQAWAYQLAVVVDDAAMGVTHVLRGADLVASTARQVLLQRTLGLPTPQYAHVPLVLGPDGAKLGKRHGAPDITRLREAGADPRRVVAWLANSAGLVPAGVQRVEAAALVADFDLAAVPREDVVLAPGALDALG
ncbi:MAG: tRNA glutamyl-Q(34) synthetase GluQRS [Deltaproteobacteria bacterium]|nr:tRNA glutamyl-Q(34) synthetase GluQRS [Deltaproteobacteria bacterium]